MNWRLEFLPNICQNLCLHLVLNVKAQSRCDIDSVTCMRNVRFSSLLSDFKTQWEDLTDNQQGRTLAQRVCNYGYVPQIHMETLRASDIRRQVNPSGHLVPK